jgi:hypothetical protein
MPKDRKKPQSTDIINETCVTLSPSEKYQTPNGLTRVPPPRPNFLRTLRVLRAKSLLSNQLSLPPVPRNEGWIAFPY